MKVVLFCGGRGMRMRAAGDATPKPLALVGDRPLIWHLMQWYAHHGHTEFVLCLGYAAATVERYVAEELGTVAEPAPSVGASRYVGVGPECEGWRLTLVETGADTAIGERLRRVRRYLDRDETFLANYSDVLTDAPLPALVEDFLATPAVVSLLAVRPPLTFHTLQLDGDQVVGIEPFTAQPTWINGGFFILRRQVFDHLIPGEDLAGDVFPRLAALGQLRATPYHGFWRPADTQKDRQELEDRYLAGAAPWAVWTQERAARARVLVLPEARSRVDARA